MLSPSPAFTAPVQEAVHDGMGVLYMIVFETLGLMDQQERQERGTLLDDWWFGACQGTDDPDADAQTSVDSKD